MNDFTSARLEGMEAYDRGEDIWFDNPYVYEDKKSEEWIDGFKFSSEHDNALDLDLSEMD